MSFKPGDTIPRLTPFADLVAGGVRASVEIDSPVPGWFPFLHFSEDGARWSYDREATDSPRYDATTAEACRDGFSLPCAHVVTKVWR